MTSIFAQIPEPLAYAEHAFKQLAALSQAADAEAVADGLVEACVRLTGCELAQIYCLNPARTGLHLIAQKDDAGQPGSMLQDVDYSDRQLLQFSLRENRMISISGHDGQVYDTGFLPSGGAAWQSLLCLPLPDREGRVTGLLLCATPRKQSLDEFGPTLVALGTFALSQRALFRRLKGPTQDSERRAGVRRSGPDYGLLGRSAGIARVRHLISKVLNTSHTLLLTGETGTGKEVVARAVHEYGSRAGKAFVVQNCAAFPEALLESELFGYRKGAFTGADRDYSGLFETANGGTLLLDEVGDMPLGLQAKLLRVLQEGEIRPLGSTATRKVDVRIIAATHRDLPAMIAEGRFRADLYYRLAQFPVSLPALRQREDDVLELARHFCSAACQTLGRETPSWSAAALDLLSSYGFPGNVRELKGMVERAVLMCDAQELGREDFALLSEPVARTGTFNLRERLDAFERDILVQCLHSAGGNRSLAARKLGVARRTLLYRMAHLGITSACAPRSRHFSTVSGDSP
ncbi:MAG: Fis family transcriptional regulator [Pseudomonas sp.]|nr:Fis family transcriptional regulator [Pseudomonas sp.]